MRSIQLELTGSTLAARLVDADPPQLPGSAWARVSVRGGGVCGSDLHLLHGDTGPMPLLGAFMPLPVNLGHEIAGVIVETGADCPIAAGTRVAVDPTIGCVVRGIHPPCVKCGAGMPSVCVNSSSHVLTPGFLLGCTQGLGGGWSEQVVAHASMLHPLPDAVPDSIATLHEPLSIALHGLLRQPPRSGDPILVLGAGIIGLLSVAAARALFPENEVYVIAKHEHQAAAADGLGATRVVRPRASGGHLQELARLSGTRVVGSGESALLAGGFPYVVEAVGTPATVTEALRVVDSRGTVLLLGIPGVVNVDLTPVWFKEVALVGSVFHAHDRAPADAQAAHSTDRAVELLARRARAFEPLVTHEFGLEDYGDALAAALNRGSSRAIKVVFRPAG